MQVRIAGTVNDSIVDGPGIRFSIFTQGCSHHCPGCQNPQTWDFEGGELVDTDDLLAKIAKNPLLKGITLTGGEPFEQPEPLIELSRACHERGLDAWAYSGYTFEEIVGGAAGDAARELLSECDVLVDGLFVEDLKTLGLKWRGSSNQRVIDVPASLDAGSVVERA
ncbi:MAG: anaerobic ribonucleoside-triphosphate reductase activating protein [Coriobacteriales bacterium]